MNVTRTHPFSDMFVMLGRSMRHIFRSMDTIITVAVMPIAMMLLFVYVFGGAMQVGNGRYVDYLLPGILLIAILMGFRSSAGALGWLAVAGILILFTLALTWLAAIAGLSAKSMDGAIAFSYPLVFLPFISSAFVPTETMPSVVRAFAQYQPVTSIVNSVRALLSGNPVGSELWIALAWCLGIMIVAYLFAVRAYQKNT